MVEQVNFAEVFLSETLGAGACAVVRKGIFKAQEVAVKAYNLQVQSVRNNAEREIQILSEIEHENVVKVIGSASDGKTGYMLMEYLQNGSLYDYLYGEDQWAYTVEQALRWAFQCAKALAYLHTKEQPVLHRDIKPQNLVLDNQFETLKITDFDLATDMSNNRSDMRGSVRYMAPEAFRDRKYTVKSDVYSFGIVLWELMARSLPYEHYENIGNQFAILRAVNEGRSLDAVRSDCPEGIKQMITRCVHADPEKRPTMKEIEEFLGKLCETGIDEAFTEVLDEDTAAVVTYHEDASGNKMMRVIFWRRLGEPIRMIVPIAKREARRTGEVVVRETVRASEDVGRETARAAQDTERETRRAERHTEQETSRAAHDGERESRRAAQDVGRETKRAIKKIGRKLRF
ncbi:putative mitogen-activated protein kinase kinase kinase 7-like [Drosophila biarmipes]|uniref:putative mitogen-activated protein kinase kinase kinase 7-like n=1 Tax=Drosophila biarmipes TaxID=125945 RepID=UPI0021CCD35F|nr:putative mitogen-activated protein kinase kinase kinase 7-like [Drosophila biarmipes]